MDAPDNGLNRSSLFPSRHWINPMSHAFSLEAVLSAKGIPATIPQSDRFTLHKYGQDIHSRGVQVHYVTENRQFTASIIEGWDMNGNHRVAWICITPLSDDVPLHDWRILQEFKNQLCGAECTAMEFYPAESDLIDCTNNFHLWVWLDGHKPPFGFRGRIVTDPSLDGKVVSTTPQRPFVKVPPDAIPFKRAIEKLMNGKKCMLSNNEAREIHSLQKKKEARRRA